MHIQTHTHTHTYTHTHTHSLPNIHVVRIWIDSISRIANTLVRHDGEYGIDSFPDLFTRGILGDVNCPLTVYLICTLSQRSLVSFYIVI